MHSYASNIQRKLSIFLLFKSAICQVALCLFTVVCRVVMAISIVQRTVLNSLD